MKSDKNASNGAMRFLYGNPFGRLMLKGMLKLQAPKVMAAFLRSPLSVGMIDRYVKKYQISLKGYPKQKYRSFAEFFERRKKVNANDSNPSHFVSPCDGQLSAYPISLDASFAIKGSLYRVCDLVTDPQLEALYRGGTCLIFRLAPNDYHHYCFMDDGYLHEHHFIEGELHSVQAIACENYPVYRLNRRLWNRFDSQNFGTLLQIEVGALAVGGIVNEKEEEYVRKGETMGHFTLCGSTIVVLVEKDRLALLPEIQEVLETGVEYPVKQGMYIGDRAGIAVRTID